MFRIQGDSYLFNIINFINTEINIASVEIIPRKHITHRILYPLCSDNKIASNTRRLLKFGKCLVDSDPSSHSHYIANAKKTIAKQLLKMV